MTDEQRMAFFKCILLDTCDLQELPEGSSLDTRRYFEPTIDAMLEEARKQGAEQAGKKRGR